MKRALVISLLVSAALLAVSGCASDKSQQTTQTTTASQPKPAKPAKPPKDKRPKSERLKIGMTEDEVVQAIGKPRDKAVNSDGSQVWTYNDWEKAAALAYWSPVGAKVHFLTVVFDADGKVKSWSSSTEHRY